MKRKKIRETMRAAEEKKVVVGAPKKAAIVQKEPK
jgi:hypothetical protein